MADPYQPWRELTNEELARSAARLALHPNGQGDDPPEEALVVPGMAFRVDGVLVRVGDTDRDETARALQAALAEGKDVLLALRDGATIGCLLAETDLHPTPFIGFLEVTHRAQRGGLDVDGDLWTEWCRLVVMEFLRG